MEQGLGLPPNDHPLFLMLQQLAADYHRRLDEVREASTTASTQANAANPQDGDAPTTTSTMASTQANLPGGTPPLPGVLNSEAAHAHARSSLQRHMRTSFAAAHAHAVAGIRRTRRRRS